MPLLLSEASRIGDVYLTEDATAEGTPCWIEWVDRGTRPNPIRPVVVNLDASAVVYNQNTARKGPITLVIPGCPDALRDALNVAKNAGGHKTFEGKHPAEEVALDVEYLRMDQPEDDETTEWEAGDPRPVVVKLWSHGSAS